MASSSIVDNTHKDLYKATFNKANPVWKDKFKQKCLQKVQQTKSSMLQRMRDQSNVITVGFFLRINNQGEINLPQIIQQEWSNFVQTSGENQQPNQFNVSNGTRVNNKQVELWSPGTIHFLEIKSY
jgi:hypothetical protein